MTPKGSEETARAGLLQSWNPKNSGAFRKKSYPAGGWTTTVAAFLFMFDFSTFPGGLGKNCQEVGVPKKRRWGGDQAGEIRALILPTDRL